MTAENPQSYFDDSADAPSQLLLDLDGYEGPIDVLLGLARDQKVDLTRISILRLADQYLDYIQKLKDLRLELAADYLVMAAWLTYLKSRLLLPKDDRNPDEPNPEEMAEALALQLRRLEAMREAGKRLMARPRLGADVFARGVSEDIPVTETLFYTVGQVDLLKAYSGFLRRQSEGESLALPNIEVYSIEAAALRLSSMLGRVINWQALLSFLPQDISDSLLYKSAVASTFAATLEMARSGKLALRQDELFGPIFVRAAETERTN